MAKSSGSYNALQPMTMLPKSQPADDCFHRMALIRHALRD
jgi:hypothetical protein